MYGYIMTQYWLLWKNVLDIFEHSVGVALILDIMI